MGSAQTSKTLFMEERRYANDRHAGQVKRLVACRSHCGIASWHHSTGHICKQHTSVLHHYLADRTCNRSWFRTRAPHAAANMRATDAACPCAAIILGGGAGTRLYPLTKQRAKPAVPIGGAYRLIDVPMSNCINSGISKIYILTQFNSMSLNRHLARAYNMGSGVRFGGDGFVEVLAATQTPTDKEWFQVSEGAWGHICAMDIDAVFVSASTRMH